MHTDTRPVKITTDNNPRTRYFSRFQVKPYDTSYGRYWCIAASNTQWDNYSEIIAVYNDQQYAELVAEIPQPGDTYHITAHRTWQRLAKWTD